MKKIFTLVLPFSLVMASCNSESGTQSKSDSAPTPVPTADPQIAIQFLNDYVNSDMVITDWVQKCSLVTDKFKSEYVAADKEQMAELKDGGEPIDLITGAMDYCTVGYKLKSFDEKTGIVTAVGKEGQGAGCDESVDGPVLVHIVLSGDKWLVDGSGTVNMPSGK